MLSRLLDRKLLVTVLYVNVACGIVECTASDNYVGSIVEEGHEGQDAGNEAVVTLEELAR